MTSDYIADTLADSISKSLHRETKKFEWDIFFRTWFREAGSPYFFLFKRNLSVTNTQYVELFALIETYCTEAETGQEKRQILFHTTEQMRATVTETVNNLLDAPPSLREAQIKEFSKTYRDIFSSTFVVNIFYNSCAIFVPPGINVNLDQVCADAGYIHSVGHSIYIRNIKKSKQEDFESSIEAHLNRLPREPLPVPFIIYAHEDFSEDDKESRDEINRGIDGTKLFVEKMSMGTNRLAQIVQDMRIRFKNKLDIPEARQDTPEAISYKFSHRFTKPKAIWLINDRSVAPLNPINPGHDRYYICYQQFAKNDNPFFYFDENKPAWKSHTTMPHSLTAALINSTRPHQPETKICDPFGGTGTTWFEVKRIGLPAAVHSSDLSPIMKLLLSDNLQFFLMQKDSLETVLKQLNAVLGAVRREGTQGILQLGLSQDEDMEAASYSYAVRLLDDLKREQPDEDQEFKFSQSFVDDLGHKQFITRIVFYIVLRAELRNQGGYKRKSRTFDKAFEKSLKEIQDQANKLLELRTNLDNHQTEGFGTYLTYSGTYSPVIVPSLMQRTAESLRIDLANEISVLDARQLEPDSLDIIICDPPYGFNTTEDRSGLADLYSQFIDAALLALREHGHLIICLPAESYTGRDLPYCTYSKLVSNQVLVKAHKLGKHIFSPGRSLPHRMLIPPYYWEAERALRRVILHFRVSASEYKMR